MKTKAHSFPVVLENFSLERCVIPVVASNVELKILQQEGLELPWPQLFFLHI